MPRSPHNTERLPEEQLARRLGDLEAPSGRTPITGWTAVTFENTWSNFEGLYDTAAYRKQPDGRVYLKGMVKHGITANEKAVFTLPTGFRPAKQKLFGGLSQIGGVIAVVQTVVTTAGVVMLVGIGAGAVEYLTLDQISFSIV